MSDTTALTLMSWVCSNQHKALPTGFYFKAKKRYWRAANLMFNLPAQMVSRASTFPRVGTPSTKQQLGRLLAGLPLQAIYRACLQVFHVYFLYVQSSQKRGTKRLQRLALFKAAKPPLLRARGANFAQSSHLRGARRLQCLDLFKAAKPPLLRARGANLFPFIDWIPSPAVLSNNANRL